VTVREIDPARHRELVRDAPPRSFLQTPGWATAKPGWTPRSFAWFDGAEVVGTGLALLRPIPHTHRTFAYLPDGPDLDWEGLSARARLGEYLDPLVEHLKARGVFAVRIGPQAIARTWGAATVKKALAERAADADAPGRLAAVPSDSESQQAAAVSADLTAGGWHPPADAAGFATGQPRYTFRLPLAGRTEAELLAGFNQLWRRSIKAAARAGVRVERGDPTDLPAFHQLYAETAERDGFVPRGRDYFGRMWAGLSADDPRRIRLYLARQGDELAAATLYIAVGDHAWYSYGASSTRLRDTRASQAVQWQMIRDARADGAAVYDLRGITDTLDPDDPHVGLLRFKVGTGGQAVVTLGEWDLPINRTLHRAFRTYLDRRS
jgi:lipid II:glycine glycyltransferase (peptidoglycan interpeptide bridge formation enzyme)